jgi:hypothetical protein
MNQLNFTEFLIIREANQAIQEANLLLYPDSFLEVRAKDYWKQGKQVRKGQIAHIDPETRKPWRSGDRTRQIKMIVKDQKRKGVPIGDIWVSHTDVNKLGIYPGSGGGGTPFGIYAYPVKYFLQKKEKGGSMYAGTRPYLQVFKVRRKDNPKIIQFHNPSTRDSRKKRAKDFDLYGLRKEIKKYSFIENMDKLHQSIANWSDIFHSKETKKGEFSESVLHTIKKHFDRSLYSLILNLKDHWRAIGTTDRKQKIQEFKPAIYKSLDKFKKGMLEIPKADLQLPENSLEEFMKNITFSYYDGEETNDYDYWNEHEDRRKYKNIDLEKNYAEFTDKYKKHLKENRGITQEGESIDDLVKHNRIAFNTYPNAETLWFNHKNKGTSHEENIIKSEYWNKIITTVSKHIAKYIDWYEKNSLDKAKNINFPFKKEIVKFSEKHGIDWVNAIENANGQTPTQFLYNITKQLAPHVRSKGGHDEFTSWTKVLRAMGIDGLADRQSAGHIYDSDSEKSQGVFWHAGMLDHIAQIDQQGHTDDREISGRPNIKSMQMIKQFKHEMGLPTKACSKAEVLKYMQDFLKSKGKIPSDFYDTYNKKYEIPWELDSDWNKYRSSKCSVSDEAIPTGQEENWRNYLEKQFKKTHRLPLDKPLKGDIEDKFQVWKSKFSTASTTTFNPGRGVFVYAGEKTQQRSAMAGAQIPDPKSYERKKVEGTLSRTIAGLKQAINSITSDLENIKSYSDSDNDWQNKFNQSLASLIKLLRSWSQVRDQYSKVYTPEKLNKIQSKPEGLPKSIVNMNNLDQTLAQVNEMVKEILGNPAYKNMWVIWGPFKRNLEITTKLIEGEFSGKLPRMTKSKMWGKEEYEKAFHIYYPGEEFIRDLPKEMWTTDLSKISTNDWRLRFPDLKAASEKWKHLVQYQTNRHIIIDNKKYKELMSKFDWLENDPEMAEFWHNREVNRFDASDMTPQQLLAMGIDEIKKFDKLITYQSLMGIKHSGNTISKGALLKDFLQMIKSYSNDPEFKKIPDSMKNGDWLDVEDILKLTSTQFDKLLNYLVKTNAMNKEKADEYRNNHMSTLEAISKLNIDEKAIIILTKKYPEEIHYKDFKNLNLPVKKAEEIIKMRTDGTISAFNMSEGDAKDAFTWIEVLKDIEKNGTEEDFYSKNHDKMSEGALNWGPGYLNDEDYKNALPTLEDYKKYIRYLYVLNKINALHFFDFIKQASGRYDESGKLKSKETEESE